MLIKGNRLNERQRRDVLRSFIYRWTVENEQRTQVYRCALCDIHTPYVNEVSSERHTHPTIPLQTDEQWLAEHAFYVTRNGFMDARYSHCEPHYLADERDSA